MRSAASRHFPKRSPSIPIMSIKQRTTPLLSWRGRGGAVGSAGFGIKFSDWDPTIFLDSISFEVWLSWSLYLMLLPSFYVSVIRVFNFNWSLLWCCSFGWKACLYVSRITSFRCWAFEFEEGSMNFYRHLDFRNPASN